MFDIVSYILGHIKGESDGRENIVIESGVNCVDDGNGNITITEEN